MHSKFQIDVKIASRWDEKKDLLAPRAVAFSMYSTDPERYQSLMQDGKFTQEGARKLLSIYASAITGLFSMCQELGLDPKEATDFFLDAMRKAEAELPPAPEWRTVKKNQNPLDI